MEKNKQTYNIGALNEWTNIDLVKYLCRQMDRRLGRSEGTSQELITYVKDRLGHDVRYAVDVRKIRDELGWFPSVTFEDGLSKNHRLVYKQSTMVRKDRCLRFI